MQIDLIGGHSRRIDPWAAVLWVVSLAAIALFFWVLADIVWRGAGQVSWSFLVDEPRNAGRAGGIGSIVVSTVLILIVCLATALPLAVGAALFLVEIASPVHEHGRFWPSSRRILPNETGRETRTTCPWWARHWLPDLDSNQEPTG